MTSQRMTLGSVVTEAKPKPDRIILYADAGWGKTSFVTRFPKPIYLTTPGEDRLAKLIEQGLVPKVPFFPDTCQTWDDLHCVIGELLTQQHDYQTFVLDTGNGIERIAREKVCAEEYHGEWGEKGFASFGRGEKVTADRLWVPFLNRLEQLRDKRRMRVVMLCHKGVVTVKNPEGADYDAIGPALSKQVWGYTHKWADMILYGSSDIQVAKDDPKSKFAKNKAKGGSNRLLHTSLSAAYVAKSVHQLPPTINLGNDPFKAYDKFLAAFPKKEPPKQEPPKEAPAPPSTDGNGSNGHAKAKPEALNMLDHWCKKLELTPADREELCAQHGVDSFADLSQEQASGLVGELAEVFAKKMGQPAATRNAGDEEGVF